MKTNSLPRVFLILILSILAYSSVALESLIPNGVMVPNFIFLCYLEEKIDPSGKVYHLGTIISFINGVYNARSTLSFKSKVRNIYIACADQSSKEKKEPRIWIGINYLEGGSELWENSFGGLWERNRLHNENTIIGGIALSSEGSVGWVAISDISAKTLLHIERWQLTAQNIKPELIQVKGTRELCSVNLVANVVNGEDKIWYICEDDKDPTQLLVYERTQNGDFSLLMKKSTGAFSMKDNGIVCLTPQALGHFRDTNSAPYLQPLIEWFMPDKNITTSWQLAAPEVKTKLGITLGNNSITYINYEGDIQLLTPDLNEIDKIDKQGKIRLFQKLAELPGQKPQKSEPLLKWTSMVSLLTLKLLNFQESEQQPTIDVKEIKQPQLPLGWDSLPCGITATRTEKAFQKSF